MKRFIFLGFSLLISVSAVALEVDKMTFPSDGDHSVTVTSLTDLDVTLGVRVTASYGIVVDNSVTIDSRNLIAADKVFYASIVRDERVTPRIRDNVT